MVVLENAVYVSEINIGEGDTQRKIFQHVSSHSERMCSLILELKIHLIEMFHFRIKVTEHIYIYIMDIRNTVIIFKDACLSE